MEVIKLYFRKNAIVILFFLLVTDSFAQTAPGTYFVQFTDKNNTPYSITSPAQFLGARAIQRRQQQGIPVTIQDLPVDPAYVDSVLSYNTVVLKCKSKWFNAVTISITDTNSILQIQSLGFVSQVRAVQLRKKNQEVNKELIPLERGNDYFTSHQEYGVAYNQIHMMNGEFLHHLGYDGSNVVVGVLDAGFQGVPGMSCYNTAFSEGRIVPQYDFPRSETDVFNNSSTHGTLVLSCMAGYRPGEFIGTAPGATYYLWVTENDTSEYVVEEDYWVAAAEAADSAGVDIINTSLGYSLFNDTLMNHTYAQMDGNTTRISIGVDIAVSKGIICVNSAGNAGTNPWFYITAPADADSVLTVGAVGPDRVYASFSSKGPSSDGRVKPNVATQGFQSQICWPDNSIGAGSGTSFSSPIMAGMVACLRQAFPDKTNMEIVHAIEQSASHYSSPDSLTGYGIPDMERAYYILQGQPLVNDDLVVNLLQNLYDNETTLQLYSPVMAMVDLNLFDTGGKKVHSLTVRLDAGVYTRLLLTGKMNLISPGMYILKIQSGRFVRTEKLVKR